MTLHVLVIRALIITFCVDNIANTNWSVCYICLGFPSPNKSDSHNVTEKVLQVTINDNNSNENRVILTQR
jgi:hypothetical protein